MNKLDSAVAVVADGGTASGGAVVDALLAHGARVVAPGDPASSHEALTCYPGRAIGRTGIEALLEFAVEQFGRVDVVVLSVGEPEDRPLADLDGVHWSSATDRLGTVFWGLRASLGHLVPQGSGRVILTMGAEAKVGRAGAAAAAAVSHGAYGLVKVAAKEAGPFGVTVNAVLCASGTDGSLVGRATTPAEVAAAVVLLASPEGGGMSGVAFPVDGGVSPY